MKNLKITGVRYIDSAVNKGVFQLTIGLTGENGTSHSVPLAIEPEQVMKKTLAELEEIAIRKLGI
nr:hypothetical protein [Enterobacter mori]